MDFFCNFETAPVNKVSLIFSSQNHTHLWLLSMFQWLILNCNQTLQVNFLAYYNNLVSQVRDLMRPWKLKIENWHTRYSGGVDSKSRPRFLKFLLQNPFLGKFGPKIQSCLFCLKIGAHSILRMQIPILDLKFWNSNPKTHFCTSCCWKVKVVGFSWKLACMASWRCWFLFQH